jgi:hypothetical protein
MQMVAPQFGLVAEISEGQDIDCRNNSIGASTTDLNKDGADCGFAGVDLSCL